MTDPTARPDNLEIWFTRIQSEIRIIQAAIDRKDGVWIFKSHTFSVDEILTSPELQRIQSLCGQIDDIVNSWLAADAISDERYKYYHQNRLAIERTLTDLRAQLIERKPTFWEVIVRAISSVIKFVMERLPLLPAYILTRIGFSPSAAQVLLGTRRNRMQDIVDDDGDL